MPIRLLRKRPKKPVLRNGLSLPRIRTQIQKLREEHNAINRMGIKQLSSIATQIHETNQGISTVRRLIRENKGHNVNMGAFRASHEYTLAQLRKRKVRLENEAKKIAKRFGA